MKTIAALAIFLCLISLGEWTFGHVATGLLIAGMVGGALIYSLKFGRLKRALPSLAIVDYAVLLVELAILAFCVFSDGLMVSGYRIVLMFMSMFIWVCFCLLRYPRITEGASLSIMDALWGADRDRKSP